MLKSPGKRLRDCSGRREGICLIERTNVAGTRHIEGIRVLTRRLEPGDRLHMVRDYDNPRDGYAVRVEDINGNTLGFLSCEFNEIISRLIDGGKSISGFVRTRDLVGGWTRIEMAVVLDD